jgi:hypothetical protein
LSVDALFGFGGEADEGGGGYEESAARRHVFSVTFMPLPRLQVSASQVLTARRQRRRHECRRGT